MVVQFSLAGSAFGQFLEFERPPINYHQTASSDPVAQLQAKLEGGDSRLEYDQQFGYLPAVLEALDIPAASQVLVFSKTSFQLRRISPRRPRAVYFNDDTYVGYVQFGDVIEVSTTDPHLGGVFYTLSQEQKDLPRFVRDKGQCLTCHASSRTRGVPGHLVRSVFADPSGQPLLGSGTFVTDHRSDFSERFGGWYVSGTHGQMRHMGNVLASDRSAAGSLARDDGANLTDLEPLIDVSPYLRPTSDLAALMVLSHQTQMHNYLTAASMEARAALHYNATLVEALDLPEDELMGSTQRRIESAGEELVEHLLFSDEFVLQDRVRGVSGFAEQFSSRGPRDAHGRSLYQLDLNRRLLRYPCSWLIYSESFDQLPPPVFEYVARRLHEVLSGQDQSESFAHLSADDRRAVLEILSATKPRLAELWGPARARGS